MPTQSTTPIFTLFTRKDIELFPPVEFLVDGLLLRESLAMIYGRESTCKTFLALDLALCVATGTPWKGHAVHPGRIVYMLSEGRRGLRQRVHAWERANGATPTEERCQFLSTPPQLLSAAQVDALLDAISHQVDPPVLIVLDTLARCMVGHDENDAAAMGQLIAAVDRLKTKTGATVLIIHHANKDGGPRGSSALPGAMDTEIEVRRRLGQVTLRCEKQKEANSFSAIVLHPRVVSLEDRQSSLVLEAA